MSYLLPLSVLLAGLLVSPRATFSILRRLMRPDIGPIYALPGNSLVRPLLIAFPIIVFACLIAIVSWLYQTTLNRALPKASAYQQQLLQHNWLQRE